MMKINKKIKAFMSIIMACFMCVGVLLSIKTDVYADSSKEYVYDIKKAIAIKLNDQYAKLTYGSCPSHHSPNYVIPFIK